MPLVEFDCGSQSISRVFTSAAANDEARLMAVVVFPTPPFWLATAITRPIQFLENHRDERSIVRLNAGRNAQFTFSKQSCSKLVCNSRSVPRGTLRKTLEELASQRALGTRERGRDWRRCPRLRLVFHVEHYVWGTSSGERFQDWRSVPRGT